MVLFHYFRTIAAAFLLLLISASASFSLDAAATTTVNVRSGPGTGFSVVDTLFPGEVVKIQECSINGWCLIKHPGPNGWVSSGFLTIAPGTVDPSCQLVFSIGASGPNLSVVCDPSSAAPNRVCFFKNQNYNGDKFCVRAGKTRNSLNANFNDKITSIHVHGSARAKVCTHNNLGAPCRLVNNSIPQLGGAYNNVISSMTVFTGAPPAPPTPVVHSTGNINLKETFEANLDNGNIGSGPGTDIWYRVVTPANKMIKPKNGARLALGDGSNRNFAQCSAAAFSTAPISTWALPVGTYVCVKTNTGRIGKFRVTGYVGNKIKINYKTWKH